MTTALRNRLTGALAATVLLSAHGVRATEPAPRVCPAIDTPASIAAAPGMRAFVDPATGKLREPTADELRQLAERRLKARTTAAPREFVVVTHPNGMQTVELGDAFLFDVRMEKHPDGTTTIECVPPAGHPVEK
jgi:hypothetical protein